MVEKRTTESIPLPRPEIIDLAASEGVELFPHEALALNGLVFGLMPTSEAEEAVRHDVMMERARSGSEFYQPSSNARLLVLANLLTQARVAFEPVRG